MKTSECSVVSFSHNGCDLQAETWLKDHRNAKILSILVGYKSIDIEDDIITDEFKNKPDMEFYTFLTRRRKKDAPLLHVAIFFKSTGGQQKTYETPEIREENLVFA